MRTLFFDIDGTLLVTQNAGSQALAVAMEQEFGVEEFPMASIRFGGRTDRDLVGEILSRAGLEVGEENRGRLRRSYTVLLRESLQQVEGRVLPGVIEILDTLHTLPQISLAVMTGNFPETARYKLQRFRLEGFFEWVVGGDLDEVRCDMARRAGSQLDRRRNSTLVRDAIVIGDTPNDVRCAHSMGAKCLAVCTGSATREELEIAKADEIVEDLREETAFRFLTQQSARTANPSMNS
ncbi:MAG: HAD family hydrolase [Planctomycetota bacterium]